MAVKNPSKASVIVPHATNANVFDAIFVGVAGNITCRLQDDSADVLFSNVPIGIFEIRTDFIRAVGTAATDMVGLTYT